jgi:hypothetical protein
MPGLAGTQKATVQETFRKRLQQLRETAGGQSKALTGTGARPWQVPEGTKDLLKIEELHKPGFDRQKLNDAYLECMQDAQNMGTVSDVIALKQQIDYVAMEERAFRLRHATVVRCLIHSAGRRHGQSVGNIYPNIEQQVSDTIAKGGA